MKKIRRQAKTALGVVRLYRNWASWFLYRLGVFRDTKERIMHLRSGTKFTTRFDLNEPGTVDDVYIRREYITPQNADALHAGSIVIDVGANIGAFSVFAATRAKNIRVFSFEPSPDTFSRLKKNIAINHLEDRITIMNKAVAGTAGKRKLFTHPDISGANTIAPYREGLEFVDDGHSVPVEAVVFADVFRDKGIERCDLLKMDCEGSEFEIIPSIPAEIYAKIAHVAMEYHRDPKVLEDILKDQGFMVTVKPTDSNSGFLFADKKTQTL